MSDNGDITLQTYEAAAGIYGEQTGTSTPAFDDYLARLVALLPEHASVLELGSGPGRDALLLESHGVRVRRTDAARAFVEMMRADGHAADVLDMRYADFGGPYDGVLADASLLHLSRDDFAAVAVKARAAVHDGGVYAFTIKEGDGEDWRSDKLDLPRHFTYWRAAEVRAVLTRAGWGIESLEHIAAREPWLYVLCRTA